MFNFAIIKTYNKLINKKGLTNLLRLSKRKNIPILTAVDCIVPNILIAQAIGRWGNFFNQEVYGKCVDRWNWLPDFLENRFIFQVTNDGYTKIPLCDTADQMVVPLCFIESILNVIGFIKDAIPIINVILNIFEPMIFPTEISLFPFNAAIEAT